MITEQLYLDILIILLFTFICYYFTHSNPDSDKDQAKLTYKWKPKQEEVAKEESKRASRKKAESPTSVKLKVCILLPIFYFSVQVLSNDCYAKAAWTSGYKDTVATWRPLS